MTPSQLPAPSTGEVAPRPTLYRRLFGTDGFQFRDVLDLVNPLQHIPLVGNLYRRMSGDVLDPAIRVAGGALFGGAIGAGLAAVALAFKAWTGSASVEPAAVATAPRARYEARGGWMAATTRRVAVLPQVELAHAPPVHDGNVAKRRGGWLVQAAYAMADARDSARHGRIDTSS